LRISIDSTDSLDDVIRVVEAAYNVTLTVSTTNEARTTAPPAMTPKSGAGSRAATAKGAQAKSNRRGRPAQQVARVSNEVLRSWARENGHTVSDRGRIPKAVVAAHREAQSN
jgi:hypothetical protein